MVTTIEINASNFEAQIPIMRSLISEHKKLVVTTMEQDKPNKQVDDNLAEKFLELERKLRKYSLPKDFNVDEIANEVNL